MTVEEAILSHPAIVDISRQALERVLINRSVNGAVNYAAEHKQAVELCTADLLIEQLASPDFTEADLSIKYDRGRILTLARSIYAKYGDTDGLNSCNSFGTGIPIITARQW